MRNLLLTVFLFLVMVNVEGQLLDANYTISVTAGYGNLSGQSDNLFFPSTITQPALNLNMAYGRKVMDWLSAGLVLDYTSLSEPSVSPGFAELVSEKGAVFSVGPQISLHSPHKVSGVWNWLKMALALAPKYNYYSGERMLKIDNEIIPVRTTEVVEPVLEMNETSSGFGFQVSPHISYRITQRVGLRLGYNFNVVWLNSGYTNESLFVNTVQGGLIVTLGNPKQVFN
ncbi:MAG: hypothetical protein JEZ14_11415 [Marinilabiliaceae bacterium]|nr:hypothetical protein [Marinilabiliaceae bacterium]